MSEKLDGAGCERRIQPVPAQAYMRHPNYNNWPSIFWRPFLVVTLLQNNNRHTSARARKIFAIRKMRPLSIGLREPPPRLRGVRGVFPPALDSACSPLRCRSIVFCHARSPLRSASRDFLLAPLRSPLRSHALQGTTSIWATTELGIICILLLQW